MVQRVLGLVMIMALAACDSRSGLVGVSPPATQMAFLSQPTNVVANAAINPPVQIATQNANGQTIGSGSTAVTLTIAPGTGTTGAVLTGGTAQPTQNGAVVFGNLRIDLPGTGYQLVASAAGFPSVTSAAFNVTP
jgi:hypothetical protein